MQLLKDFGYLLASIPFLGIGFAYEFVADMFVRGQRAYRLLIRE
jgi:hypothetical protein